MLSFFKNRWSLAITALVIFYLISHLAGLLQLPVFADEAIYIRWSQLIIDDLPRYLFFPMNDGKTPLFFWLLAPFQFLFDNQLYSARFVSVLIGLAQMLVTMKIVSLLTKNRKTIFLSGFLVTILPFWYFHHRMALTDGLMTLMISVSMMFLITEFVGSGKVVADVFLKKKLWKVAGFVFEKQTIKNIFLAGLFFGLSLLTKIPAILFIPSLFLLVFLPRKSSVEVGVLSKKIVSKHIFNSSLKVLGVILIGFFIFLLLSFVPSFPQLFGRGSDFLLPLSEVLAGKWKETLPSLPVYFGYFVYYMTPTLMLLMLMGLFLKKNKTIVHVFFWSGILFILPIGLMGKMVYPRYLFPATISFTLASVFAVEELFVWAKKINNKFLWKSMLVGFFVLLISNAVGNAAIFMITSVTDETQIPFVSSDVVQYLTEWSSGHGLVETVEYIREESKDKTIAVATEGSFGSLPDGLNLYFHRRDVSNLFIDGVGYPVTKIPEKFAEHARNFDRKWLVINSHRMNFDLDSKYLLKEYCRPFNAPCLQIWDITDVFEDLVVD